MRGKRRLDASWDERASDRTRITTAELADVAHGSDRAISTHAGLVHPDFRLAAVDQTVQMRQALSGSHLQGPARSKLTVAALHHPT